jgi:N-acetylmuramoyl-L-alanine amidase
MPTVRSSVRSGAADARRPRLRRIPAAVAVVLAVHAVGLHAQRPELRVTGALAVTIDGSRVDAAAAYPALALARLGFQLNADRDGLTAALDADTLRFWAASPWFTAGGSLEQLAFPVRAMDGSLHLPEQFFIQWLPSAWPERFAYRDGALVVLGPVAEGDPASGNPARPDAADRTRVVVIDPGHGGRDPGSIGPNGLREKDVTLMISRRLASILEERGYEVHLTRTTDTLIALGDRPRLANLWRGDRPVAVFLSIHTNSVRSPSARGFETFFLSEAQTEDERRVAEMENDAVRYEDSPDYGTANGLDRILTNLRSDFLMRASHDLATVVQDRMAQFHPGPDRGVKRGGLIVLIGSIMPAVLIETGFISNPGEAGMLGTQGFQQKLAWGIADAVDEFFSRNEHLWAWDP